MSRAIAAAKPSIESAVAADRQPTRQSRKQRLPETDQRSTSIKALAKTTASVNHRIARPPRLILIDAPFSPRLSRYSGPYTGGSRPRSILFAHRLRVAAGAPRDRRDRQSLAVKLKYHHQFSKLD